jgi:hypothetical protein
MGATGEIQVGSSFITAPIGEAKTLENPTFTMQIWSYLTGGTAYLRAKVYLYRDGVETLLFTTSDSDAVPTSYQKLAWAYQYSGTIDLLATDRLVVKIFANRTVKATGKRLYIAYDHSTRDSRVFDPETRYFRSDTQTVNGLTAYKLLPTNTTLYTEKSVARIYTYVGIRVWKRSAAGVETEITAGKAVARVTYGTTYGVYSATWSCPSTPLDPTDAIVVRVYDCASDGTIGALIAEFITEQLGAKSLDASTWTVYYWLRYVTVEYVEYVQFRFGDSTYNSRIENFTWTPAPVGVPRYIGDGLSGVVVII